jgi:hypothetical protein
MFQHLLADYVHHVSRSFTRTEWARLISAMVLSFLLMGWAGSAFHLMQPVGMQPSLLAQPFGTAVVSLVVVLVLGVISTVVGAVVAGAIAPEAGVLVTGVGMTALSRRGGPIHYGLFAHAGGDAGFAFYLMIEVVLLYAIVGIGWIALLRFVEFLRKQAGIVGNASRSAATDLLVPTIGDGLTATGASAAVTAALMLLLCQSDAKGQCIGSLVIAAFVGSIAAHYLTPIRQAVWFWAGPLVVGVAGYLVAAFDPALATGFPSGMFAALARPLPLDYAGIGAASAIFGFWTASRWHHAAHHGTDAEGAPPTHATGD